MLKRLDHIFVLAGSITHFLFMMRYVVPAT
jgi:predicted membrane channel-forming protein YqfA (hemolysin III family)